MTKIVAGDVLLDKIGDRHIIVHAVYDEKVFLLNFAGSTDVFTFTLTQMEYLINSTGYTLKPRKKWRRAGVIKSER